MLIGLNGRKQAGKDTVYQRVARIMDGVMPVERLSFADLLYQSAAASLGVTVEELQEWKSDPNVVVSVAAMSSGGMIGLTRSSLTVREYLQRYGTEAHREVFGTDFWVEQVAARLADHQARIVMVTDCRFPNEALAVRAAGGAVVCVVGPDEIEHTGDAHASEAPLPEHLIDAWVPNKVRDDNFRTLDHHVQTMLRLNLGGAPC